MSEIKRLNLENFDTEINSARGPYLIKFFSPTCGPCKTMKPVFEAFSEQRPDFSVFEIDTMESPHLAEHFNVRGVPYTAFCEGRELIFAMVGVAPLRDLLYVAENINDPHLRQHGTFKTQEAKKEFPLFIALLIGIVLFYAAIMTLL